MNYGYFDDDAKEYVITRPDTPRAWSNYLGSLEYGAIITNNAGGYLFMPNHASPCQWHKLARCGVPSCQPP